MEVNLHKKPQTTVPVLENTGTEVLARWDHSFFLMAGLAPLALPTLFWNVAVGVASFFFFGGLSLPTSSRCESLEGSDSLGHFVGASLQLPDCVGAHASCPGSPPPPHHPHHFHHHHPVSP